MTNNNVTINKICIMTTIINHCGMDFKVRVYSEFDIDVIAVHRPIEFQSWYNTHDDAYEDAMRITKEEVREMVRAMYFY